jgi:hypothetical protein
MFEMTGADGDEMMPTDPVPRPETEGRVEASVRET